MDVAARLCVKGDRESERQEERATGRELERKGESEERAADGLDAEIATRDPTQHWKATSRS
eukprot:6187426-Pleurochrysis_carterae.AAC.2